MKRFLTHTALMLAGALAAPASENLLADAIPSSSSQLYSPDAVYALWSPMAQPGLVDLTAPDRWTPRAVFSTVEEGTVSYYANPTIFSDDSLSPYTLQPAGAFDDGENVLVLDFNNVKMGKYSQIFYTLPVEIPAEADYRFQLTGEVLHEEPMSTDELYLPYIMIVSFDSQPVDKKFIFDYDYASEEWVFQTKVDQNGFQVDYTQPVVWEWISAPAGGGVTERRVANFDNTVHLTPATKYLSFYAWNYPAIGRLGLTSDGISTGVYDMAADNGSDGIYTLSGIKLGTHDSSPGLFIERKDGKTRKIIR